MSSQKVKKLSLILNQAQRGCPRERRALGRSPGKNKCEVLVPIGERRRETEGGEGVEGKGGEDSEALTEDAKIVADAGAVSGCSSTGCREPPGVALVKKVENCWCQLGGSSTGSKEASEELSKGAKIVADAGAGSETLAKAAESYWKKPWEK